MPPSNKRWLGRPALPTLGNRPAETDPPQPPPVPARVEAARTTDIPCSTSDYFPTTLEVLGFKMKGQPEPIDGVSLVPLIDGEMDKRPTPIGFESANQVSLTDNRYKIYSDDKGKTYMLFDLIDGPAETENLAAQKPQIVETMKKTLENWRASCKDSLAGKDYG